MSMHPAINKANSNIGFVFSKEKYFKSYTNVINKIELRVLSNFSISPHCKCVQQYSQCQQGKKLSGDITEGRSL